MESDVTRPTNPLDSSQEVPTDPFGRPLGDEVVAGRPGRSIERGQLDGDDEADIEVEDDLIVDERP